MQIWQVLPRMPADRGMRLLMKMEGVVGIAQFSIHSLIMDGSNKNKKDKSKRKKRKGRRSVKECRGKESCVKKGMIQLPSNKRSLIFF